MDAGRTAAEVGREVGVSAATIYSWKAKYGGMSVSEAQEAKQLRDENTRLKKLVADLSLDKDALQAVIRRIQFPNHPAMPNTKYGRRMHYHSGIREFVLMYGDMRHADSPRNALLDFLQSTYEAGSILGHWDRASLEGGPRTTSR
jgi:putative transposase